METTLQQISELLQNKLNGAPADLLVLIVCWVVGYLLRWIKRFPNDGIPIVVILMGAVVYPLIADDNNEITLRVWLVRNVAIGFGLGFGAWLTHTFILKWIENKLGLFVGDKTIVTPPVTPPAQPPTTPTAQ